MRHLNYIDILLFQHIFNGVDSVMQFGFRICSLVHLGLEMLYCPLVSMLTCRRSINAGSSVNICVVSLNCDVDLCKLMPGYAELCIQLNSNLTRFSII